MSLALLDPPERARLREKAVQVEELVRGEEEPRAPSAGAARLRREREDWYRRLEDAVLDLSNELPAGADDHDARKLFEFLIELRRAITADTTAADPAGDVELATLRIADVASRLERRLLHNELDVPETAARFVFETLADVGAGDLARLLGVSTRTIGAWRHGGPVRSGAGRVVLVAQLISYLRGAMTPRGVVMWFDAPADQLAGRAPLTLLDQDEAAARPVLTGFVRGGRGQLAD